MSIRLSSSDAARLGLTPKRRRGKRGPSEAEFMGQVLALAKLNGWRRAHFRPARTAHGWRTAVQGDGVGFPDLILVRGERLIVAELKRSDRDKLRAEQADWLIAFRAAGVKAYVFTPSDWPEIERILR